MNLLSPDELAATGDGPQFSTTETLTTPEDHEPVVTNTGFGEKVEELSKREDDDFDPDYTGEAKEVDQNFTYPAHADQARLGDASGVYLDDQERIKAEVIRAKIEGREPDLDNPPAIQSTPLEPTHVVKSRMPSGSVIPVDSVQKVVIGDEPREVEED